MAVGPPRPRHSLPFSLCAPLRSRLEVNIDRPHLQGEINVDQAHRGYDIVDDESGKAWYNPF